VRPVAFGECSLLPPLRHPAGPVRLIGATGQSEEEEELVSGFGVEGVDDAGAPSLLAGVAVVPVGFVLVELERESVE
jgi:hypothetical protein